MDSDKVLEKLNLTESRGGNLTLLSFIDSIPYPIQIYDRTGASAIINKAFLTEYKIESKDNVVGKYNVFRDLDITTPELLPFAKRAFNGEIFFKTNIKVPLEEVSSKFGVKDLDVEAMFMDITIFPLYDADGNIPYAAAVFINRRMYRGKKEVASAKEYIKTHCLDKFDINAVAKAACLSKTHLVRLFKKHTGATLYEYYLSEKMEKLKEKLLDKELTVTQVFGACGLNYNGHFAGVFKRKTGLSPSQYRKLRGKN